MRLHRSFLILVCLLLGCAAGRLYGQSFQVSLGATAGSGIGGCSLTDNQVCQLTALVTCTGTGCSTATRSVDWNFSPTVPICTSTGTTSSTTGCYTTGVPDASGLTTATYTAPTPIATKQSITVTATVHGTNTKSNGVTITLNVIVEVGAGAPTSALQYAFLTAYNRNGFNSLVSLPPLGQVKLLGASGYVQEFSDAAGNNTKYALVTVSPTSPSAPATPVVQLLAPLYAFYTTTGVGAAGYPLYDTLSCPSFDVTNSCQYDLFDKGVALFAYTNAIANGQNFSITGAFYTEWNTLGGISGPGRPTIGQTNITAAVIPPATAGTAATVETFAGGAIYSITSGPNKGRTVGVVEPIYDLYVSQNGPNGTLGLPTTDAIQISNGVYQQTFEGAVVQYSPGSDPVILLPVGQVSITGAAPNSTTGLTLGQTVTLTATPMTTNGAALTGRPVSWTTSNSKVVSIQATGATAVITAVGGGAASVQAVSQGVASAKVNFVVTAPCCQVGDGAPTAVQQAFQDALARNKIAVQLPVAAPVSRVGNGYVQTVQSTDAVPATYLLAQSDQIGTAYVVSGGLLARYTALGGPAGALGYPTSDASAGGTQLFSNGNALAGNPVRLVSGVVLAKWKALGYENGAAGLPLADAVGFITPGGNSGQQQTFATGVIFGATAGPRSGQAYFVSGLILGRFTVLGGAAGDLGMPISDEFASASGRQQNFEGGNITYSPGDSAAVEHLSPRTPTVVISPSTVFAGGRVRLAATGFSNNATLKVSVTGQPDFVVTTPNGAYSWDMAVPLAAKSGTVTVKAADSKGPDTANGTLTIKGFADNRIQISKIQGDNQTGVPGALLPVSLRVALVDGSGNPVVGATVTFQASSGALVSTASTFTDSAGRAETWVRLPAAEGVAAVSVAAPAVAQAPVTFFAMAQRSSLPNFPNLVQSGDTALGGGSATIAQKGALLTAVTAILRYHQNRSELRSPNGLADTATLNSFLKGYCTVDLKGGQVCDGFLASPSGEQIVNLWRAADFTGGVDVRAFSPTTAALADLVAQGAPALVSLALSRNGSPAGGHSVVAIGVGGDGSILILDPNPFFGRTSLKDYLNGFSSAGVTWTGEIRGVAQFALRNPGTTRFLAGALSQPPAVMQSLALGAQSAAGACGTAFEMQDLVDGTGSSPAGGVLVSRLLGCDGLQSTYEIDVGTTQPFRAFVTDLATAGSTFDLSGSSPAAYKATRVQLNLVLAPQDVNFTADGVVNGATFTSGIAPGGIFSIFGSGLSGPGTATTVDVDGTPAAVITASPFQINAVLPVGAQAGIHAVRVKSAYGTAQQTVAVSTVAPAIFLMGDPTAGAVENQDGSLNGPSNPGARGQALVIYATGLGSVRSQGQLSVVTTPVTVVLNGQELQPSYAGLTPGFSGLYQVNVVIPVSTPPGLGLNLSLKQGDGVSNTVLVTLQ